MAKEAKKPSTARKLWVTARNVFSTEVNPGAVGVSAQGNAFRITHGESLAYALAVDDSNDAYFRKEGAIAPPLFASRILKDCLESLILSEQLGMNVLKMVHGSQSFQFHAPLVPGADVVPRAVISDIRSVSSGQIVEMGVEIRCHGEICVSGMSSMFLRSGKPAGGGAKTNDRGKLGGGDESLEALCSFAIAAEQPRRYAAASHDYNPLHTRPLVARLAGFRAPIAHGLCVMAVVSARLVDHFADGDPARLERLSVRFSQPAYPGDKLTLRVRAEDSGVHFQLDNPKGRAVLSKGEAAIRPA
jgi:acyl dehydratase